MEGTALDKGSILSLINADPPLLEGYVHIEAQIQPNGFDLTLQQVSDFKSVGQIDLSNAERVLPNTRACPFGKDGYLHLESGSYLVTFNEVVHLPLDLMALGKPRSSLLRCGVVVHNAVWDAGYQGRSQALMVVYNREGFRVKRNARLIQLVFLRLAQPLKEGYQGAFMGENLP